MKHQPDKQSLIAAARKFMTQELSPTVTDKALQYKMRIAINVLAMVERELAHEQCTSQREAIGLRQLLKDPADTNQAMTRQLCQDIREGRFDNAEGELLEYLEQTTLDRLAIDNPRYSTYRALRHTEL